MVSSGMLRCVALIRTDVSEDLSASFIRVKRIGELGTTLAVTSNRRTLRRNASTNIQFCHLVFLLLGYKIQVRTSQETHHVSAAVSNQLMLCKI
jgi:hypothetical protein